MNTIVIGAGGAMGSAICTKLLERGDHIWALGHRIETLRNLPEGIDLDEVDATSEHQVCKFFEDLSSQSAVPNVLINLVGIHCIGAIQDLCEREWDRVFTTNVKSAFLTTKWITKMIWGKTEYRDEHKVIINLASKAATRPMRYSAPYNASKAALRMFSFQAARELAQYRIAVICLSPGIVGDVPTTWSVMDTICQTRAWTREQALAYQMEHIPWGEMVTTEEIAEAVLYLSSYQARKLTGSEIQLAGGQY